MGLALCGIARPPTSYQGGKQRWAAATLDAIGLSVGAGAGRLLLNDVTPSSVALAALRTEHQRIAGWVTSHGRGEAAWRAVAAARVPDHPADLAAAWWLLQSGSALGKPVTCDGGEWRTRGYGRLSPSAVARGFRDRCNPPALARRLSSVGHALQVVDIRATRGNARHWHPVPLEGRTGLAYIDPPYRGTTGYRGKASRELVIEIANRWHESGYVVVVAEAEPIADLGGRAVMLDPSKRSDRRPTPKRQEWITVMGEQ